MYRSRVRPMGLLVIAAPLSSCSVWNDRAHDWLLTEVHGANLSLAVPIGSSSRNRFDRLVIEETDQTVTMTAVVEERSDFPFEGICTADMRSEAVTAFLDEPLGDRELLGCAPGPEGLQNFFDDVRQGDDCAEIVPG